MVEYPGALYGIRYGDHAKAAFPETVRSYYFLLDSSERVNALHWRRHVRRADDVVSRFETIAGLSARMCKGGS
jgi:hypothetical protein